jgi:UDP-3-O-[3-hydroxymyristoyl] glucosamine N-acyltransferase
MTYTAARIAEHLDGEVIGDGNVVLTGFTSADRAGAGDLTFAEKDTHFAAADASSASAILVSGPFASTSKVIIRVPNARVAAARVLPLFFPPEEFPPGIHPSANIAPTARVDASAHVGPGCVIGAGVTIGARSALLGGNHIGRD